MRASARAFAAAALAGNLAAAGCSPPAGPRPIAPGTPCAACGMAIEDFRFACERQVAGRWRAYDSIECLARDAPGSPAGLPYLSDYDGRSLHRADSMWVVKGSFPSPMGGGYAAFLDRAAADEVAAQTAGRVARLRDLASARGGGGR